MNDTTHNHNAPPLTPARKSDVRQLRPPQPARIEADEPEVGETAREVANHLARALAELRACIGLLPAIATGLTPPAANDGADPPTHELPSHISPPSSEAEAERRILAALDAAKGPLTVQQLAAELRTSSGWVWHWLNLLDPAGKVWLRTTRSGGRKTTLVYAAGSVLTE